MRRSGQVGLVLLTALGLSSCGSGRPVQQPVQQQQQPVQKVAAEPAPAPTPVQPLASPAPAPAASQATMTWDDTPRDPCAQQYFDEALCQQAIQSHGYHYGGMWVPVIYTRPYSVYYNDHETFVLLGGVHSATPSQVYDPSFRAPAAGTVVRGGFGGTAAEASASHGSSSYASEAGS